MSRSAAPTTILFPRAGEEGFMRSCPERLS
jgi:hypothetical protein